MLILCHYGYETFCGINGDRSSTKATILNERSIYRHAYTYTHAPAHKNLYPLSRESLIIVLIEGFLRES